MTRSTRELQIPASLLCEVHKMMIIGSLVAFLAVTVQNWVSVRPQVMVGRILAGTPICTGFVYMYSLEYTLTYSPLGTPQDDVCFVQPDPLP